jgi:hypothetical protein
VEGVEERLEAAEQAKATATHGGESLLEIERDE